MKEEQKEKKIEEEKECQCSKEKKKECPHHEHDKKCEGKHHNKKNAELEKLKLENEDLIKKIQYAQAELVNYRKRKDEEVLNFKKYCNKDLITELIPIIDNFERAIKLDDNDLTDEVSKFLSGFKMMYSSLIDTLKKFGVEEINRVGEVFDPAQEQALLTDHVEGMQDDIVIEVLLKGYKLKDRVIRPASVKVNQN